jgi:ubiquinone/menaquinone biosynthesis C-methylase UbiE
MATSRFTPEITDDLVRVYEQYLVPAVYAQWASRVSDIAEIERGQVLLDVACGTGTLARTIQLETGLTGKVIGLDASEKLLDSARKQSRHIAWQLGNASAMPFETNRFDRVLCQFALMFTASRVATIKEMLRVCRPNGLIVVATWGPLQLGGAYDKLIKLINKYAGAHAAMKLSSPWSLGKPGALDTLLLSAGVNEYECHERVGQARYPSLGAFVETHLRLSGEFEKLSEETLKEIMDAAHIELRPFLAPGGQLIAQLNANIFTVKAE